MERDKSLERSWDNDAFNFFFCTYLGCVYPWVYWRRMLTFHIVTYLEKSFIEYSPFYSTRPYIAPSNNKQELPQKYQPITSFYNLLLGLLLFDFRLINTFFVIFSANLLPFWGFSPQYTAILTMEEIIFLYYKILSCSEDWSLYLFENEGKILTVPEEGLFGCTPLKRTSTLCRFLP